LEWRKDRIQRQGATTPRRRKNQNCFAVLRLGVVASNLTAPRADGTVPAAARPACGQAAPPAVSADSNRPLSNFLVAFARLTFTFLFG
jgi:hypothetical protein